MKLLIHLLTSAPTDEQLTEMLECYSYIKLAVDVRRRIVAGGGEMHADCEAVLLRNGSRQVDVWGADWRPTRKLVTFDSLINIRPAQGNTKLEIQDPSLRSIIEEIVRGVFDVGNPSQGT